MDEVRKILAALLLTTVVACSTKYDEVKQDTELEVLVYNDATGVPINHATVCLYVDSIAFYNTISSTGDPSGFVSSSTTNDAGIAAIGKLHTNVKYFLYSYYKDTTIIHGTYITLDNSTKQYALKNTLADASKTTVSIPLTPADGFVVFWTGNSNNASLPINVLVGGTPVGAVTGGNVSPLLFQPGSLSQRLRQGSAIIEGKSSSGCYWTNQLTVTAAAVSFFGLADCTVGTIAFYTDNLNAGVLPIQITLNANDMIGAVSAVVSSTPADCAAANLVTAARVPGDYTYQAVSASGNCLWSGAFTITAGGCNLTSLTPCN